MHYPKKATCGFCPHFGKKFNNIQEDICLTCEVSRIRSTLQQMTDMQRWEYDIKYRPETDAEFRMCYNCKHCISAHPLYHFLNHDGTVSCALDRDKVAPGECYPTRPECSTCSKWERHRGHQS